jgi:PAS domain S-box-containing protein
MRRSVATMPFFTKYISLSRQSNKTGAQDLLYWRERILKAILCSAAAFSLVAIVPILIFQIKEQMYELSVVSLAVLASALFLLCRPSLAYPLRAVGVLAICFVQGLGIILWAGIFSGGPAWLFTMAVVAGLLLGVKAAFYVLLLNSVTLATVGGLAFCGSLGPDYLFFSSLPRALMAGFSFVLLNLLTAVSVSVLLQGLQSLIEKEEVAKRVLKREQRKLIAAKEKLKVEIQNRKQIAADLKKSKEKYRLMTEKINDIIWTMDLDMNFSYISPAIEKVQGWTAEEALQLSIDQFLTPEALETSQQALAEQLLLGEKTGDYRFSTILLLEQFQKSGATIWTEVTASFILDDGGYPVGILGVTRDVTERQRNQIEKEELQEKLNRAQKMESLGLLAGGVAHDLNNVLSGIVSYPDLILMDLSPDSPLRASVDAIKDSGLKAASIVQDLLTLARRGVTTTSVLNMNHIIQEYLSSPEYKKLLSFHPNITVTVTEGKSANIEGSAVHLRKTIMNLVSNAAEAQPQGGSIHITTASRHLDRPYQGYQKILPGDYVVIQVQDRGEGITEEDLQRIFEPFYTKKVMGRSGTGLGMAVVWGTMRDHHGYIDISSQTGHGTTVTLYFPMTHRKRSEQMLAQDLEKLKGQGESILVVDDLKSQRRIATHLLTKLGYRVETVASGEAAVKRLGEAPFDLVVLDMIMDPDQLDGLDTYKQIVELHPGQKAIIASGYAETDRVKEAYALGVGAYVKKPYTITRIGSAVRGQLGPAGLLTDARGSEGSYQYR